MTLTIRAAGGVVWDRRAGRVQILLVHRPRHHDWSLPKGKAQDGESDEANAVREVEEETGFRCRVGVALGTSEYEVEGQPKRVQFWAMRPIGGAFERGAEVDEVQWVDLPEAARMLTWKRDAVIVSRFARLVEETPLLFVRHASAGKRASWDGDDLLRPLDKRGLRAAKLLPARLGRFDVTRIVSSPYVRCVQTVEPLAAARGLEVEERAELAEGAAERAAALARDAYGESCVLCTHGDVLAALFDDATKKGSTTVAHVRDGRFAAVDAVAASA